MAKKKYLNISNNFYYNGRLFKEQEQYDKFSRACTSGGGCGCGKPKPKGNQKCVWKIHTDGKVYTLPDEYAFESDVLLGKEGEEGKDDIFQEVFDEGRGKDSKQSNMYHDMTTDYKSVQHRNNPGAIRYAANHIKM